MQGIGKVGFVDKPIPKPGPNDAVVRTTRALICTSDSHTGLCPGGRLRMERLLRVLETDRVDPTTMTTHTFAFDEMPRAIEVADQKREDAVKVLVAF
jgi:threonine dehydrogenase-like Zn-dependent dehydrogenase